MLGAIVINIRKIPVLIGTDLQVIASYSVPHVLRGAASLSYVHQAPVAERSKVHGVVIWVVLKPLSAVLAGAATLLHDLVQLLAVEDDGEEVYLALRLGLVFLQDHNCIEQGVGMVSSLDASVGPLDLGRNPPPRTRKREGEREKELRSFNPKRAGFV